MGIDKHLILTLRESHNRQHAMLGGSVAMQTPRDKIFFIEAVDNDKYDNDMQKIADAAAADNFPYVHQFARGVQDHNIGQSVSGVNQVWSYSRILRYIAQGDDVCLLTFDDRILSLPFPWIDKITESLQDRDEDFYFWQLRVRLADAHYNHIDFTRACREFPEMIDNAADYIEPLQRDLGLFLGVLQEKVKLEHEKFCRDQYMNPVVFGDADAYIRQYLMKDCIGYDETFIISPKGAAWMLLQAMDMEELSPDMDTEGMPYWETYLHKRNTFDCWILNDLRPRVKDAVLSGKGIYCPQRLGYRYVHDWLPMGSNVEWTNLENPKMEQMRNESTDINFLEIP